MNKRLTLEEAIKIVSKEEIENFYKLHTRSELLEKAKNDWHIGSKTFKDLLKYYNIVKSREDILATTQNTCIKKYGTKSHFNYEKYNETINNRSEERKLEISAKLSIANKYIQANMTEEEKQHKHDALVKAHLNRSEEDEKNRVLKGIKTKIERYGSRYNSDQYERCRQKLIDTNISKYGVPYFCMTGKCRSYSKNNSKPNIYFASLLEENNISYEREFTVDKYSYDFKVGNNLIEINPSATHNSTWGIFNTNGLDKDYHFLKSKTAFENGFRCIHIFDWEDPNIIIYLLKDREKIYARKCEVKLVDRFIANEFINKYHIQGDTRYNSKDIRIGLFYNNNLVSIMTFGKPRYSKKYEYELLRYCSSFNVIGGAEKIFKHFIKTYKPSSIISYCDNSKFNGDTYTKLGFIKKNTSIGKHWYNLSTKRHITDNLLRQRGFDQLFNTNYGKDISNVELMLNEGFIEIYDAGQTTYTINLDTGN